ncbi:Uncharacterised protein [Mycobacteroides abscessus subsp. abscessus]|nr:Uncharacterised protein [Mycobacteroides abscessus subsp. abscessus]
MAGAGPRARPPVRVRTFGPDPRSDRTDPGGRRRRAPYADGAIRPLGAAQHQPVRVGAHRVTSARCGRNAGRGNRLRHGLGPPSWRDDGCTPHERIHRLGGGPGCGHGDRRGATCRRSRHGNGVGCVRARAHRVCHQRCRQRSGHACPHHQPLAGATRIDLRAAGSARLPGRPYAAQSAPCRVP